MKQLELWPDSTRRVEQPEEGSPTARMNSSTCDELTVPKSDDAACMPLVQPGEAVPPLAVPLPSAVEAGVFGIAENGPIEPDQLQVQELTAEHANEMIIVLADSQVLEDALRHEYDPATGRVPSTPEQKQALLARLDMEWKRALQAYADAVAAFADGFGEQAAQALDQWVRKVLADAHQKKEPYPPSHPWHYFHAGDNAPPTPVEEIKADADAGRWLADSLPKNPKKRVQAVREMLEREKAALDADKVRYVDIVERGAEALSRYDREIAHTSDAMAVATALALKYTHIQQGLGRLTWLEDEAQRLGCCELPFASRNRKGQTD